MCEKIYDTRMKELIYKVHLELMPVNVQDVKLCHDQKWLKWIETKWIG